MRTEDGTGVEAPGLLLSGGVTGTGASGCWRCHRGSDHLNILSLRPVNFSSRSLFKGAYYLQIIVLTRVYEP
jgi:hypothetical protein